MVAEPMFLADSPEMVPESYLTGAGDCARAAGQADSAISSAKTKLHCSGRKAGRGIIMNEFPFLQF
jgi:hypothetical protein